MIDLSDTSFILGLSLVIVIASLIATFILIKIYISSQKKLKEDLKEGKAHPGIRPSLLEEIIVVFFLLSALSALLGSIFLIENLHWLLLKAFVYQPGDILVTGYGFGFLPVMPLAILLVGGFLSVIFDQAIKWWAKRTNQTVEALTPLTTIQQAMIGISNHQAYRFIWQGIIILLVLLIPAFFSYTRLTQTGLIQRHWPGIITKEYTFDQITGIWQKNTYSSHSYSQQPKTYYAITFDDGWEWKSTQLWERRDLSLREVPEIDDAITLFAQSAGLEIK